MHHSATVMASSDARATRGQYRNSHYLDKHSAAGEATTTMTAGISTESAKAAADIGPQRIGVLLVNLGTPDSADASGVRVYLKEFLSDPRVIEDQGLLWKLVLNGIILRTRPARKARDYQKIWNTEKNESPLKTITRAQSDKLGAAISDQDHVVVDWATRYASAWASTPRSCSSPSSRASVSTSGCSPTPTRRSSNWRRMACAASPS